MSQRSSISKFAKRMAQAFCCFTLMVIAQNSAGSPASLETVLRNDPSLSLFSNAMDIADVWPVLNKEDSVTLFVPTNKAMELEGSDFLLSTVLLSPENKVRLKDLISSHIVSANIKPGSTGDMIVRTMNDACLSIVYVGDGVKVGTEAVVLASTDIGNYRLITIDRLLIPSYFPTDKC